MTPDKRHECMSHINSKDTGPELIVRKELWNRGFRYRLNVRKLHGTPDIVIAKYRTVIFVNGCFWHGHSGCSKYVMPKSNVKFWKDKIARNQERDLINAQRLESIAWNVITVWECEITKSRLSETMTRIESEIIANRVKWEAYSARRRKDRQFAIEQSRKRKEVAALVEAELRAQLHIPIKIRNTFRMEDEDL